MKLKDLQIKQITRIIAHTIHPKTAEKDAFAVPAKNVLAFSEQEKGILIGRIIDAISNSKKTFQLQFEDRSASSIYSIVHNRLPADKKDFIQLSTEMAEDLAAAHFRLKIPGGYCLIGEGITSDNKNLFFIIKAELQEVFTIEGNNLQLVKDVFLSPAKDFYKIGLFIQDGENYIPFMYDDQFSPQKKDLTEYFYGKFLGLTTDKNDSLKSKNFYNETRDFIIGNVLNLKDQMGLLKALTVLFREETSGIISPRQFSNDYLEGELKNKYDKIIDEKYPQPFVKDVTLIDKKLELQRITIPLTFSLSIVGNSASLEEVEIFGREEMDQAKEKLEAQINNHVIRKCIFIKNNTEEKNP